MARIFISHSGQDNFEALAFQQWLIDQGWLAEDIFLDLHNIDAGARWKDALRQANERCEAVVLLASPVSLLSTECRLEIRMAEDLGKEIIVAILHQLRVDSEELDFYRERQIVDLSAEPREATFEVEHNGQSKTVTFNRQTLASIKSRLDQLGISPTSFAWRPGDLTKASPYPGFDGFKPTETALFFGRAGDIARGLAELRKLRRSGEGKILLIQAASGAGKSSFLKAGLWQRLNRDSDFTTLAILRPATGILTGDNGIGKQMATFFAAHNRAITPAEIHKGLKSPEDKAATTLVSLLSDATAIGHAAQRLANPDALPPTPLIAVDQAEELFASADSDESNRFLSLLARLLDPAQRQHDESVLAAPPVLIWTIRADSVDKLLHAIKEAGLKPPEPFLLPPIPRDAYREIIQAPLNVANQAGMKLTIDPLLVDRLVDDSKGADALPMLSYTLRQLLGDNRSGMKAHLALELYGGMDDVLQKRLDVAVRNARLPSESLQRLFISHLATWDNEATPPGAKRQVAEEAKLLNDARADLKPLVDALVDKRLLTQSSDDAGTRTLEVAHEALLRQPPLSDWLEQDREFLVWRDATKRARKAFERNTRGLLMGRELEIARGWLDERTGNDIDEKDRAYIEQGIYSDRARRHEEKTREIERTDAKLYAAHVNEKAAEERAEASRRIARRTTAGMMVALLLAMVAGGAWLYAYGQKQEAEAQRQDAVKEKKIATEATKKAVKQTHIAKKAAKVAEIAKNKAKKERNSALVSQSRVLAGLARQRAQSGEGAHAMLLALNGLADPEIGRRRPYAADASQSLYSGLYINRERKILKGHTEPVNIAVFSPNGTRIVTASNDGTARLWETSTGKLIYTLKGYERGISSAAFSPDGSRIFTASWDGTVRLWDTRTGQQIFFFKSSPINNKTDRRRYSSTVSAKLSPDGKSVLTTTQYDYITRLWNAGTGKLVFELKGHTRGIRSVAFSPDGRRIVTASRDATARVWDVSTGKLIFIFNNPVRKPEKSKLGSLRFSLNSMVIPPKNSGVAK